MYKLNKIKIILKKINKIKYVLFINLKNEKRTFSR